MNISKSAEPATTDLSTADLPSTTVLIAPTHGWVPLQLGELWRYRELLYFLVWRDIKVRYKQTVIGILWAIIQPFMTMVVFSLFFGGLAKIPSDGMPYPIFSYTALIVWSFFVAGLTQASNSLVGSAHLIKKVYFPRLIMPLGSVVTGVVDFVLAFIVLLVMILIYNLSAATPIVLTIKIIWLLPLLLLALITALGTGLWLSAMNVQFRDIKYVLPFLVQFWMFATPIAYPSSLITNDTLRAVYALNPMSGVIEGFRWALLGTGTPPGPMIVVSMLTAIALLISGAFYFRRMERSFADVV
jgi:lipopolysaccharide transport system permease protein